MRILLAEDEENIREAVSLNLELEGYEAVSAKNGKEALRLFQEQHFDLVILDVMLPEIDGFQVCAQIRLSDLETPIIFLTAKDTAADRIAGLKRGADDYLTKPFVLEELLLRVQKLLRRSGRTLENTPELYVFGNNRINFVTFEAEGTLGKFILTKKEAMLLKLLIDREGEVVSRQQILQSVWGYDVFPSTRTIDNFILKFRRNFEEDSRNPVHFHAIRGVGYKFVGKEAPV
ncbi:MAG: response regulator transcription factor [Saprospiraceae bacterium]|jgi:two-component system alkaline phosphatase synthesis response regulator PhoP